MHKTPWQPCFYSIYSYTSPTILSHSLAESELNVKIRPSSKFWPRLCISEYRLLKLYPLQITRNFEILQGVIGHFLFQSPDTARGPYSKIERQPILVVDEIQPHSP